MPSGNSFSWTNTLKQTLIADRKTERLQLGPPEDILVRSGVDSHGEQAGPCGQSLMALYHITDLHHIDSATGRTFELFRDIDLDNPDLARIYRPWSPFTGAMIISAVKTMNAQRRSVFSDQPIAGVVVSGDLVDNAQENELRSLELILDGCPAPPFPGSKNLCRERFKCSAAKFCASASSIELTGEKLEFPALLAYGNHDMEAMGFIKNSLWNTLWAMQPFKLLPGGPISVPNTRVILKGTGSKDLVHRQWAKKEMWRQLARVLFNSRPVYAGWNKERGPITMEHALSAVRYFASGIPLSISGFTRYTARPKPGIVFIVLDSHSHSGGSLGHLMQEQLVWLGRELKFAEQNRELAIVVSHHPSYGMTEPGAEEKSENPVDKGKAFKDLLCRSKAVIAHLAGHTHYNEILYHPKSESAGDGYWEIVTCSLIDYPQQLRFLELFKEDENWLSIVSCMINHQAPIEPADPGCGCSGRATAGGDLPLQLASFARKMCYLDRLAGFDSPWGPIATGKREDRNVKLMLRHPYSLPPA